MNIKDNDLQGTLVVLPAYNDISATLEVSPNNQMEGQFKIIAVGNSDLNSTAYTRAFDISDCEATLTIRQNKDDDLSSKIDIKYRGYEDFSATMQTMVSDYLDATLEVRPRGIMYGLFEILEPPRITEQLITVKDATTRTKEEYKYINYGSTSTMMVGSNDNETLKSFIEFDLSEYSDSLVIEKAKIRLYYSGTFDNFNSLELWSLDREWKETGITEANRPLAVELLSNNYIINEEEEYVEFEVLDTIVDIVQGNRGNNGFTIISNNANIETDSFFTKESSLKPYLEITYFDTNVPSVGQSTIEATLFAYGAGIEDLDSFIEVHSDYGFSRLEATLYCHRADTPVSYDTHAYLTVSSPEINSTILAYQVGESDLNSTLTVVKWEYPEHEAYLNVNTPELWSTAYVRHAHDTDGTLHVRALEHNNLESKTYVNIPELPSYIYVMYRDDLDGYITIQQNKESTLTASLAVTRNETMGTVRAKAIGNNDLDSTLFTYRLNEDTFESSLNVSQPELSGTLKVMETSDIDSTILIYQNKASEIKSSLGVNQTEIQSTLTVMIADFHEAKLGVNQPEIIATVTPRVPDEHDHEAFMYPRVLRAKDLNSYLTVHNKYLNGGYYYIL